MSSFPWFVGWLNRHRRRHPDTAPDLDSDQGRADWEAVRRQFEDLALAEAEADELTDRLRIEAPTARTHLRRLVELARELARGRASRAVIGDRAAAEAQARGCPECGGCGLTARRFPAPERMARNYPEGISVACYCHLCPMGRWLKEAHRSEPDLAGRVPDLAEHLDLWAAPAAGPAVADVRSAMRAAEQGLFAPPRPPAAPARKPARPWWSTGRPEPNHYGAARADPEPEVAPVHDVDDWTRYP